MPDCSWHPQRTPPKSSHSRDAAATLADVQKNSSLSRQNGCVCLPVLSVQENHTAHMIPSCAPTCSTAIVSLISQIAERGSTEREEAAEDRPLSPEGS